MEAATNQSGWIRISPLVLAVAASVTIASLIGLGTVTGMLPNKRTPIQVEGALPSADPKAAQPRACALCGTIESIRTVEVSGDTEPAVVTEAKGGNEAGPRENSGASVLDTLSDAFRSESGGNARKRQAYRVTLRMDDGSFRAISLSSRPAFAVGEKVRVVEGRLVRG